MNKKGFTGLEVLAVLAIGGALGLLSRPKDPKICLTQPAFTQMIFQMGQTSGIQESLNTGRLSAENKKLREDLAAVESKEAAKEKPEEEKK